MSIEKWTLIAESIGTIAIIVSLLFVGYEVRQSTTADYAATYESLSRAQIDWRLSLATNPELLIAWSEQVGMDIPATSMVIESLYLNYEQAYFARNYGRLGDKEWARYQQSMCNPLFVPILNKGGLPSNFTDEFWSYIQSCSPDGV